MRLLGETTYDPATIASYPTTSATLENVDATNLAVTFTVPPSGEVLVEVAALVYPNELGTGISFGVRDGSGVVAGSTDARVANGLTQLRGMFRQVVSGLTAGSSLTWYFAHKRDGGTNTPNTYAGGAAGPARIAVYSVDTEYAINHQTGTSYTLALSDAAGIVKCDNASPFTLTVPPASSVAFPNGSTVIVKQHGAGTVTVAEGSGVTVNTVDSLVLDGQHAGAQLVYEGSDVWWLVGRLAAP